MMDRDENELVSKIVQGDMSSYRVFVEKYQRLVGHIGFRLIPNAADRQDVCQDVFIKAYENLPQFHFQSKISTWIARIAYHTCLNYLEKKKVPLFEDFAPAEMTLDDLAASQAGPDKSLESHDIAHRLQEEVRKMPVQYRTILTFYHLDEMSYAEIGEITNLPAGTVKSYLFRARLYLKERLLAKYQKEELYT
jgi:RNA polymerase sigma factor (sigma-70 family)